MGFAIQGLSKRTGMSVIPRSSDVFLPRKKTRHQQMYMDVHLLMRYLPALFSSASVFKMTTKPLSSYDAFAYQNRHGCCWFHPAVSFVNLQHPCCKLTCEGLSKNFSFWTASLDLDAMFKIKSLLYKDLILNSSGMFRK